METCLFKQVEETKLYVDFYIPETAGPHPMLVWIHGGALIMGSRMGVRPEQLERYTNAGYMVASIDYRLGPEAQLDAIIQDVKDAYAWLVREAPGLYGADPKRTALVGHSAGGYLALSVGDQLEPAPRAILSFYGYGDITGEWYTKPDPFYSTTRPLVSKEEAFAGIGREVHTVVTDDPGRRSFYLYCRQQGRWPQVMTGFDPQLEPEKLKPYCPIVRLRGDYPPVMLLHGDADTDVPIEQSQLFAAALEQAGVRYELIVLPGALHTFDKKMSPEELEPIFQRVMSFLEQSL